MATSQLLTFCRLGSLSLLLSPIFAQDNTIELGNTDTVEPGLNLCPSIENFDSDDPINSTGSVNLHWNALMMDPLQNDWTFTLTYNETRNQLNAGSATEHYLQSYISAPEASDARTCVFLFNGLNRTASSTQQNGCDGVLDDACIDVLRNITFGESNCNVPELRGEFYDGVRKACGVEILDNGTVYNGELGDYANKTCSIEHPPGSTVPENYRTWAAIGRSVGDQQLFDRNSPEFTWYDTIVRQTVPFVVAALFSGGILETQVLCVAPKEIVGKSRVPAERSAASQNRTSLHWTTVVTVIIVTVIFTVA